MEKRELENFENKKVFQEEKIEKIRSLLMELIEKDAYFITNKIAEFAKNLQKKYSDYHDYRLYCIVVGSTPTKECSKFDFEGDDSVEKFLGSLREFFEKNENK
ncbi:MAG: hypothetical protein AAB496_01880 [Patescibacteria group bacterium]